MNYDGKNCPVRIPHGTSPRRGGRAAVSPAAHPQGWCPGWDLNPHSSDFEPVASASWAYRGLIDPATVRIGERRGGVCLIGGFAPPVNLIASTDTQTGRFVRRSGDPLNG